MRLARRTLTSGERNGMSKVTEGVVIAIRTARYSEEGRRLWPRDHPASLHSLAARFGLSVSQVSKIALGRQWRACRA